MINNYCTIYFVRHGLTDWNKKRLVQGHTDIPLNSEGEAQASGLAAELKDVKFDKAFSSDLLRAKRTAEIIAAEHNLAVETTKALREREFGHLEGKNADRLKEIYEVLIKLDEKERPSYKHHPSIESDEELMARLLPFLRETAVSLPGKTVLIVSHGGPLRTMAVHLGLASYGDEIGVENLSYIKLESDGVDFFVKETKGISIKKPD